MAQQKQGSGSGPRDPSQDQGQSQRKPNLSQGADAMSPHPDAQGQQQRKPNLDQGADAMSRRPDAADSGSEGDRGGKDSPDQGGAASNERARRPGGDQKE